MTKERVGAAYAGIVADREAQERAVRFAVMVLGHLSKHVVRRGGGYPTDDDARFRATEAATVLRSAFPALSTVEG